MRTLRGFGTWKILGFGLLASHLGCISPFHESEHHSDQVFGNVILRHWGWEQKKWFGACSTSGYVSFTDCELLDRNESSLVDHVHEFCVQGESPTWGVATISASLETFELRPYIGVLDLEKGAIRATLNLPAPVHSRFNPQFNPEGNRLLLACREGRSTVSLFVVTWDRNPSLKCLYREEGKLVVNESSYQMRPKDPLASELWSSDGQSVAVIVSVGREGWTSENGWHYPTTELVWIPLDGSKPRVVQTSESRPEGFIIHWDQNGPNLLEKK